MGCFVRGGKNGMGCFVRGDKNCMGCFVLGGKLMRDVLSGVAKNGMGCFVPGCFVLHSKWRENGLKREENSLDCKNVFTNFPILHSGTPLVLFVNCCCCVSEITLLGPDLIASKLFAFWLSADSKSRKQPGRK